MKARSGLLEDELYVLLSYVPKRRWLKQLQITYGKHNNVYNVPFQCPANGVLLIKVDSLKTTI